MEATRSRGLHVPRGLPFVLPYLPFLIVFGIAPTIYGLNGRWAVPGSDYGQRIVALAHRMRGD